MTARRSPRRAAQLTDKPVPVPAGGVIVAYAETRYDTAAPRYKVRLGRTVPAQLRERERERQSEKGRERERGHGQRNREREGESASERE